MEQMESSPNQTFNAHVIRRLKLILLVEKIGQETLYTCVQTCFNDPIQDLFKQCQAGSLGIKNSKTGEIGKINFFPEHIERAKADPSGKSFDITFLAKILKLLEAENPKFFSNVKAIKVIRNNAIHDDPPKEEDYEKTISKFQGFVLNTLSMATDIAEELKVKHCCDIEMSIRKSVEITSGIERMKTLESQISSKIIKINSEPIEETRAEIRRKVVDDIGQETLYICVQTFLNDPLQDLVKDCQDGSLGIKIPHTGKIKKTDFTPEQMKKAQADPSGKLYDIPFLSDILSLLQPENPDFYKNIKDIKTSRNKIHNVSNEEDYEIIISRFEGFVLSTLSMAPDIAEKLKDKLCRDKEISFGKLDEITIGVERIKTLKSQISSKIIKIKSESIEESRAGIMEYLKTDGQKEIIEAYNNYIFANPVEFFVGTQYRILVSEFYTELEFRDNNEKCSMPHDSVIEMAVSGSCNAILEGTAGVGKTTLIRTIMAIKTETANNESLLIHLSCRDDRFSSLKDLLSCLMPKANAMFTQDTLMSAILDSNPVFVVDGVDEMNENSEKVVKEIVDNVQRKKGTLFATSRPERVGKLLRMIPGIEYKYLEIRGIPKEKRYELIQKYIRIFSENFSTTLAPSVDEVTKSLKEVEKYFKEYMGVPIIVCLLVYLLMTGEKLHSKQSISEIYNSLIEALLTKLKNRISASTGLPDFKVRHLVETFFSYVCKVSLNSLKTGEFVLRDDTALEICTEIEKIFGDLREDVLSSFFVCRGYLTANGHYKATSYSFPHKSFQEFLAAKALQENLINRSPILYRIFNMLFLGIERSRNLQRLLRHDNYSEALYIFVIGIMSMNDELTGEICRALVKEVARIKNTTVRRSIRQLLIASDHPVMTEILSQEVGTTFEIDTRRDNLEGIKKLLQHTCPGLDTVTINLIKYSDHEVPLISEILNVLKIKEIKIELDCYTPDRLFCHCAEFVAAISGGRSQLTIFEGCLSDAGIQCLPLFSTLKRVKLYITDEREARGIQRLTERIKEEYTHSQKNGHFELELDISSNCPVEHLPLRLEDHRGDLCIRLKDLETSDDFAWAFEIAKRLLPRSQSDNGSLKRTARESRLEITTFTLHEKFHQFLLLLAEEKIHLTRMEIDWTVPPDAKLYGDLKKAYREKLGCLFVIDYNMSFLRYGYFLGWPKYDPKYSPDVGKLPAHLNKLEITIDDEEGTRRLEDLTQRMEVAEKLEDDEDETNNIKRITIKCLRLFFGNAIVPKKIPIPSEKLELVFYKSIKKDVGRISDVFDRLPAKTSESKCHEIEIWVVFGSLFSFLSKEEEEEEEVVKQVVKLEKELKAKSLQPMKIHICSGALFRKTISIL